jgi:diguanylate cyclase (GGDEF)-like protein
VKNILLVDGNISLSKMMAKLIESELDIKVDVAHSLSEAKMFVAGRKYILAILDLNLSDAPDGEIVDLIAPKIPSIVLSANIDKELRKKILSKDIIDYVSKGSMENINYLINTIKRLTQNQKHKVMVVEDSMLFRNVMSKMLKNMFFQVIATAHGEEAVAMLKENPDIKIVLTDYNMPVMDGLELTREIRKTHSKNELFIFVVSSNEDEEVSAKFLKNGASDYINKPFSKEQFICRINNAIESLENIDRVLNLSVRDALTGLYNKRYFQTQISKSYNLNDAFTLAILSLNTPDIDDDNLVKFSQILTSNVSENDIVIRLETDEFALFLKECTKERAKVVFETILQKSRLHSFTTFIGASAECEDSFDELFEKADMNLHEAKNNSSGVVIS